MTDSWAIVELMGHVRLAGRLTEEERFGSKMGRLDIPTGEKHCTELSAAWCHIHGDCKCDREDSMNDPDCPLHCDSSTHGDIVGERFVTQYFGGGSVYRITAVTEAVARQIAKASSDVAPVKPWDYPKAALPAISDPHVSDNDLEEEEADDFVGRTNEF